MSHITFPYYIIARNLALMHLSIDILMAQYEKDSLTVFVISESKKAPKHI
jgi:hypothetical protein